MAINFEKQRMNIELNQIRSILDDFRKTLNKCLELSQSMNMQMPQSQKFKIVEKITLRKIDLIDVKGLVAVKNQLVKALTELFQIQRELRYKKDKFQARRQIQQTILSNQSSKIDSIQQTFQSSKIDSIQQTFQSSKINSIQQTFQSSKIDSIQQTFQSSKIREQTASELKLSMISKANNKESEQQKEKQKTKKLQIPLYRTKNESNQNKIDRISKYIASLKRSIKLNSQTFGYKWKIKEFLLEDANYLKLRQELEKYMMREEELYHIIARARKNVLNDYINASEILESNSEYKLIKIYKQGKNNLLSGRQDQKGKESLQKFFGSQVLLQKTTNRLKETDLTDQFSLNAPKISQSNTLENILELNYRLFNYSKNFLTPLEIQFKANEDFDSIRKELERSTASQAEMLSKMKESVKKGNEKIIELRQKRKKILQKDSNVWDQLQKI